MMNSARGDAEMRVASNRGSYTHHVLTSVSVLSCVEDDGVPVILHSLHGLLQTVLLAGRTTDGWRRVSIL